MSISAADYVFNFTTPSAPRLSVQINSVTSDALNSAISAYDSAVSAYESAYQNAVTVRDAIADRFENDLTVNAEGMTSQGVNLASNYFHAHVKADNVYDYVTEDLNSFTTGNLTTVISAYDNIYSNVIQNDSHSAIEYQANYATDSTVYDTQAVTITSANCSVLTENSIFIKDVANAAGTAITYTNYVTSADESTSKFVNTSNYKIAFGSVTIGSSTASVWTIASAVSSAAVLAYTTDLTGFWTTVSSSSSSSESSSSSSDEE